MKTDFFTYQAQTSQTPFAIEISHAKGNYIWDTQGVRYLDCVAGVSACTLGHCHPKIIAAVNSQMQKHAHVMVYGEFIQKEPLALCKTLASTLPKPLTTTYLVNSGTEAVEGALKLARKVTGRSEIIYAQKAYHGNTMGALSVMGFERRKKPFKPLLPKCKTIQFNKEADLDLITSNTAAVILETIQGGAGFILPINNYLKKVKARCEAVGALLILDEIQPGFGRTGKLFGFQHYNVVPDILVLGKGMGGGLPIGAFTSSAQNMAALNTKPELGHITTFGGNPVIASAANATLEVLLHTNIIVATLEKETLVRKTLTHPAIQEIRGKGLMLALILETEAMAQKLIHKAKDKGVLLFGLLYEPRAVRFTPPLTISKDEIKTACAILTACLETIEP